jgi:hypothetical protein
MTFIVVTAALEAFRKKPYSAHIAVQSLRFHSGHSDAGHAREWTGFLGILEHTIVGTADNPC